MNETVGISDGNESLVTSTVNAQVMSLFHYRHGNNGNSSLTLNNAKIACRTRCRTRVTSVRFTRYRRGRYPFRSVLDHPTRATLHKLSARSVLRKPCLAPSPVDLSSTSHAILYHAVAMWPRGLTARSCSLSERGGEHTGPALRAVYRTISGIRYPWVAIPRDRHVTRPRASPQTEC